LAGRKGRRDKNINRRDFNARTGKKRDWIKDE